MSMTLSPVRKAAGTPTVGASFSGGLAMLVLAKHTSFLESTDAPKLKLPHLVLK